MPFVRSSQKPKGDEVAAGDHDAATFPEPEIPGYGGGYGDESYAPQPEEDEAAQAAAADTPAPQQDAPTSGKNQGRGKVALTKANKPYIIGAMAITLAFGGFAAYKIMGAKKAAEGDVMMMQPAAPEPMARIPEPGEAELPAMVPSQSTSTAYSQEVLRDATNAQGGGASVPPLVAHESAGGATQNQMAPATPQAMPSAQVTSAVPGAAAQDRLAITAPDSDAGNTEKLVLLEKRLRDTEDQNRRLQEKVNEILVMLKGMSEVQNTQMAKQQSAAKAQKPKISNPQQEEVKAVQAAPVRPVAKSNVRVVKPDPKAPKVAYKLFAIRSDRAWLRAPDGATVIVRAGDTLAGAGVVKEINVEGGAVILEGGARIAI